MKKTLISILALAVSAAAFAQKSLPAVIGEVYVDKQASYTPDFKIDGSNAKVRNVILLIGDGMGIATVNGAMYANGGELTMTNLKTFGYVRTQSADNFTTDSAASGTAYAIGKKTNNGYIGVGPDLQPSPNIPERIAPLGYVSGVVSTDDLNGATPAAFFAHQSARGSTAAIWKDLVSCKLSFASAGSQSVFESMELSTQDDIRKEFEVVYSLDSDKIASSDRLVYLPKSVKYDERGNYLVETTKAAIDYLSKRSKKGFFLMVEGARIDKEAHSNVYDKMVRETLDFDKAVEAAIRFAEADGHTLVIISADHETGGVSVGRGAPEENYMQGVFSSRGHTAMMVPLFAFGPHSNEFMGCQENSDVSNKIVKILGGK